MADLPLLAETLPHEVEYASIAVHQNQGWDEVVAAEEDDLFLAGLEPELTYLSRNKS